MSEEEQKDYLMTDEEFKTIKAIAQDKTPVIKFGNYW